MWGKAPMTDSLLKSAPATTTKSRTLSRNPDDREQDGNAEEKKQDLLSFLAENKRLKAEKLSPSENNLLKSMNCTPQANGGFTVFDKDSGAPLMAFGPRNTNSPLGDGGVKGPISSPENIDRMLKGYVAAKATFGDDGVHMEAPDRMSYLMVMKAAQLTGLKTNNSPAGETLDQVNPALARKMEQEWARMQSYGQTPSGFHASRGSVAATVGNLGAGATSLAGAPPLSNHFDTAIAPARGLSAPSAPAAPAAANARPASLDR